jgi:phosphoglycolate phosphatase
MMPMKLHPGKAIKLTGRVTSGIGKGAMFTELDWVQQGFLSACGIVPHPGTLNVTLDDPVAAAAWQSIEPARGIRLAAPDSESCDALLFPVRIGDRVPAAIVQPQIAVYPADQLELIAAVNLREQLSLSDDDRITVTLSDHEHVTAAIFDVDGTLLNSLEGYQIAVNLAAEPYQFSVTLEQMHGALNSGRGFWEKLIPGEFQHDPAIIETLRRETRVNWPSVLDEHVDVLPGVANSIRRLHAAGIRLAVYTGSEGESLPPLERSGLLDCFEFVLTAQDVSQRKPHPAGILRCLELLGADPLESAYIGDSVGDVDASLAAGVTSISVLTGAGCPATLAAAGTHQVMPDASCLPQLLGIDPL